METTKNNKRDLKALVEIMARLRGPDGCPWDREQTMESLRPFIIEEAYEVVSAIDSGDPEAVKEELGDLLFQIVFASRLAEEKGHFDIGDVVETCSEKMIRRHPHVFGGDVAETSKEVLKRWAEIKRGEKGAKAEKEGCLSDVPEAFPALLRAHKVSEKAAKAGFDWKDVQDVLEKVSEELDEFREALRKKDPQASESELGDLLFTLVNVSRFVEVNPEEALRKTIGRFINRFHHIEKELEKRGLDPSSTSMEEMERLWAEAKKKESQ